jgi:hypothetical protein
MAASATSEKSTTLTDVTKGEQSMKRRPITVDRASVAIELRYNLFRRKWQPDLCCAVPVDHPVPGFITGERWDFGGAWEAAAPPPGFGVA